MNRPNSGGFSAAACLLITLGSAPSVFANCCLHYQTVTFSVPGATRTVPTSINSSGAVAGVYYRPLISVPFGFVRDPDGSTTVFQLPAMGDVYINDAGVVAGSYSGHGFVGNPKVANGIVSFDPPGSNDTVVRGINALGSVTGYFRDAQDHWHGFAYNGGASYTIDYPGALETWAEAITSQGVVAGVYKDQNGNVHGFWCFFGCSSFDAPAGYTLIDVASVNSSLVAVGTVRQSGPYLGYVADLLHGTSNVFQYPPKSCGTYPADCMTEPFGINSSGTVVGSYWDAGGLMHVFLGDPSGLMVNVDPSGSVNPIARAINDAGAFTGSIGSLGFITILEAPPPCCVVGP